MSPTKIHVIDDDEQALNAFVQLGSLLPDLQLTIDSMEHTARERLQTNRAHYIFIGLDSKVIPGSVMVQLARNLYPDTPVFVTTCHPTIESAIELTKCGATDYLSKPLDLEKIRSIAQGTCPSVVNSSAGEVKRASYRDHLALAKILGTSLEMRRVISDIRKIAPTDVDVLITGETGTGKELVAKALHEESHRVSHPFVPVDCGAIPDELMESELFGHEKGAFTGAQTRTKGLLEHANHGTFFLDEITQLPPRLQAKLLRVLQERQIRRIGSLDTINLDIRIISASSLDLEHEVEEGHFRMDLYHRIHVARIDIPPLCKRRDDISMLVQHFLKIHSKEMKRDLPTMDKECFRVLEAFVWPGNVRQLENVIKRTLAMCQRDVISVEDLPENIAHVGLSISSPKKCLKGFFYEREMKMLAFEKAYLEDLMERCQGNISRAMNESKLPKGSLYRFLKKCDIDPGTFRKSEPTGPAALPAFDSKV